MAGLKLRRRRPSVITLADRARDARQWELAARLYRKALDRNPRNPPICVQYGHVLKEAGHLRQAEDAYRAALAFQPGNADSQLQLGRVLKLQGKKEEAQAAYLRAFALEPSLRYALEELRGLGWSQAHLAELQILRPGAAPAPVANGQSTPAATDQDWSQRFYPKWYLRRSLDVARSGLDPLKHILTHGLKEGRKPTAAEAREVWNAKAGERRQVHWLEAWHSRWRGAFSERNTFAEDLYRSCNPDVKEQIERGAFRSGVEHWVNFGVVEDLLGRRGRVPGYCETSYLQHNHDVAAAVANGSQPSGYSHFLMWGYSEGRIGWSLPNQLPGATYDFPKLQARLDTLVERPLISLIVPAYETDPRLLEWCIESVRRQVYPTWELCIADDGSARAEVRDILLRYARLDKRIKTVFLEENRGISTASNAALALAAGSWVALLDHDDEVTADALLEIAVAINANPTVDVIYSDEDKISVDGGYRYDPSFKPDWSPDFLKSTMYIGHLTAYRRSLIARVGAFRSEFDGTQDYDLALRATEIANGVHHIPKILYHWRATSQSAALNIANKGYAIERQKTALEGALMRTGAKGNVMPGSAAGTWRVCYAPPTPHPLVSILIPTAGYTRTICGRQVNLLRNCVESLIDSSCYDNFEIVIVDNDDLTPDIQTWLAELPQVTVIHYTDKCFNLCEKINIGARKANGEYLLLLNDDIEVISPGFLYNMVGLASQPGVGAVGAKLLFPDGKIQHNGVLIATGGPTHALLGEHASALGPLHIGQLIHNVVAVTGACLLVRSDLYRAVGGFDPAFPLNYNDVDFCLKLRERGLRIVIDPGLLLYHFESASKMGTFSWELQKLFQHWPALKDPYFNPNYNRQKVYFEPRQPNEQAIGDFASCFQRRFAARRVELADAPIRFSIIVSVYNTPRPFLQELQASLFNQCYQNFECVIVENGSTNPETLQWFEEIRGNPRVKAVKLEINAGIMGGYRAAFCAATGEYVVPVDSDDFLTLDALAIFAKAIGEHNRPALLYSDECKSNAASEVFSPFHKPDWDPVLFTNICYTCHLCCVRRDLAIAAGCYEDGKATWSHDWDTSWRLHRADHDPVHVSEITYAWRIHPGSTSSVEHSGKPEAPKSQKHVLTEHLQQSEWGRSLEIVENKLFPHEGMWRLQPKPEIRFDGCIVVDLRGGAKPEVESLLYDMAEETAGMRLIFVAGTGDDRTGRTRRIASNIAKQCSICVMAADDIVGALHQAASGHDDFVVWIGQDTVPRYEGWLIETAGLMTAIGDAVLAGGRVINPDNRLLWAGGFFGINGFLDSPDFGLPLGDSGYHGMVHCQRSVDGVPSVHWVARRAFLAQVIERLPGDFSAAVLATALALRAAAERKRVLYTPFNLVMTRTRVVRPAVPDTELERALGASAPGASRYYNRQLSQCPGTYWVPSYQTEVAEAPPH